MEPVRPDDWKREALPRRHTTLTIDQTYDADSMQEIRLGLLPEVMEDKWFLYYQDDRLHFHRSWTGYCLFVARFEPTDDGGARLVDALASRDPDQYSNEDDAVDVDLILSLIDMLLLGRLRTLPTRHPDGPEHALESWSLAGRATLGKGRKPGRET